MLGELACVSVYSQKQGPAWSHVVTFISHVILKVGSD